MKKQVGILLLVLSFMVHVNVTCGQENFSSNIVTEVSEDDKLLISYDINSKDGSKSFSVILMLTENGKKIEPSSVYGDVGSNIEPGSEKAIVWYFKNDIEGNINDIKVDIFAYKENEPVAIFKIVNLSNNAYAPSEISFSNNSSYANEYQWDFGNPASGSNNISFQKEPKHIFEKGGVYSISLTARNTQLGLENKYYQSIEIKEHEATVADFEIIGNNQLVPAKVEFISKSVNADVLHWDFGDPASKKKNTSDKKDPNHKYSQPGTYKVELTVKNNFSGITHKLSREVVVEKKKVVTAGFTYSKTSETAPATVVFKNTSEAGIRYEWNFGDATSGSKNTSTDTDPAHVYAQAGNYTVLLNVYSEGNKKPVKYSEQIKVAELPKPPKSAFIIENNNVLGPATIVFKNSSENATSYLWEFGDPDSGNKNTSTKISPTHTYKNAGEYEVKLIASHKNFNEKSTSTHVVVIKGSKNNEKAVASTNNSQNNSETKKTIETGAVVAGTANSGDKAESQVAPIANFSIENEGAEAPAKISFSSTSIDADTYLWNFGDPGSSKNSSTKANDSHTYNKPGRYEVTLTATNKKSGIKDSFSDFVTVSAPPVQPIARFSVKNNNKPAPVEVEFTSNAENADVFEWDFGDTGSEGNKSNERDATHVYTKEGTYSVKLKVQNAGSGLWNEISTKINVLKPLVKPTAKFELAVNNVPAPAQIQFTNRSESSNKFEWDFGDKESANNSSLLENPSHTYSKPGTYRVTLKASNTSSGLSQEFVGTVSISAPIVQPKANFEFEGDNAEAPAKILFTNTSIDADIYSWNFNDPASGDSNQSQVRNAQHIFETPGEYKVELRVKNEGSGKEDAIEKTVTVKEKVIPLKVDFEVVLNSNLAPAQISFKNLSEGASSYEWNFGDYDSETNTSKEESPVHTFERSGAYKITLEAKSEKTGFVQKMTKTIILKSSFITFVKSAELEGGFERAYSVVQSAENEYMVAISGASKEGGSIVSIKGNGQLIKEEKMKTKIYGIIPNEAANNFLLTGVDAAGNLFVQQLDKNLKTGTSVVMQENKNFKTDFAVPKLAFSQTNEIGVIANVLNDKYPIGVQFLKTNSKGQKVPLLDRTFKYVGTKLATDLIPTQDGGFTLTGYWRESDNSPMLILFGIIDRKGRGEMHLINSSVSTVGYDIEESYQGGYAVLRTRENFNDEKLYDLSFILISDDGGPTDCATLLPCKIKKEDVLKYEPAMHKTETGYVIAAHTFNGEDYNLMLYWIDKSGDELLRYEEIMLPNDQFVMDFVETSDGGFLIAGTEKVGGKHRAILVKTDKYGQLNE